MPIPIPVPGTPLSAADADIARAEQLLGFLFQTISKGSIGSAVNTPPTYIQDSVNGSVVPLLLQSPEQQIFYRQLAVALTIWLATPPPSPTPSPVYSFNGTCLSTAQLGDIVYLTGGASNEVRAVDLTDFDKMPVAGCLIQKPTPTTCVVQTSNIVSGIYTGLTPGRIHFAGRGSNPKPVYPAPIPSIGETIFIQPVGIAINSSTIALAPSTVLTKIKG